MKIYINFIKDYNFSSPTYHIIVLFSRYLDISTKKLTEILKEFFILLRIHIHYRNLTFGFVAISKNSKLEINSKDFFNKLILTIFDRLNLHIQDYKLDFNSFDLDSMLHPSITYEAYKIVRNAKLKDKIKKENLIKETKDILFDKFIDSLLDNNKDK